MTRGSSRRRCAISFFITGSWASRTVLGEPMPSSERMCARAPAPGYPDETRSVGGCLGVVMEEECEHHRFALRDLAVLEAR